ncbi:helix-turn-helix transcriptional regulator [Nakamurella multipartita]|uniref:helix-turn-helix transcriptional regulator n=1 Tax=Nakamurella multipartita TaxID=53461 RepID=UPI00059D581A|nr:LuxR family transcriptional regulator [Nakamurella multipartita]
MLVGREPERQLLGALVEGARRGLAGTLVVRGEPGVGKSALLEELVAGADATVLRTQGVAVEAPLVFAALHRLLRPLARLHARLPEPQARALRIVFGEEAGGSVEPFLVGVATLSLLTSAAEENLVLCVVDDAHWLDPATAGALLFCARRLGADRVAMVFAARDGAWGSFDAHGLPETVLAGLDPVDSRTLLQERLGSATAADVLDRLVAETRGNPLALMELPGELTPGQLSGSAPLPSQLHLTAQVEQVFLDRSRRLPAAVQTMLLLAAADDTGELEMVRQAATALGLDEADLQAALGSGLLVGGSTSIAVRHPLVRSAIYQAATGAQRREVHRVLAVALSGRGDPDRKAWHLASAAQGPDREVVGALQAVGARAQRRGGHAAALAAYERAAALCDDRARRAELTFAAARSAWACGRAGPAQTLLTAAREGADDPLLLGDIARLRGHIEVNLGSAAEAHRIFVEAAQQVYPLDAARALDIGVAAAVMRTFGADSGTPLAATHALVAPVGGDPPRTRCLRLLLAAMTSVSEGDWSAATVALDLALEVGEQVDDRDLLWNLGNAALQLGDDQAQQRFYGYALSRAREAGAVTAIVYCLQRLCFGYYLAGDLVAVRSSAEEALSLGSSIGQPAMTAPPVAWLTLLAALQDRDDYDEQLARLGELVAAHPLGILSDPVHDLTRWAKGLRAAGSGDGFGAVHHLARFRMPVLARMAAPERIEAAARAGDAAAATGWTEELARFADATRRPWALATVAFGRALLAGQADAEALFHESLTHHKRAERPLAAARAQLAYGEWLRRSQRRVDARKHLREAVETFQDLRAEPLIARASQELRASGETARKRDPTTLVTLTPTELQIARLVSSGLSNKDVAAQCWVSPRTVAFHLRNVFAKAGVTSRGELARLDLG